MKTQFPLFPLPVVLMLILAVFQPGWAKGASTAFFNVTAKPGLSLLGQPLLPPRTDIEAVLRQVPEGTEVYKFEGGDFKTNVLTSLGWYDPAQPFEPGEGLFLLNPFATALPITFEGQVLTGDLTNSIPAGLSIKASKSTKKGRVTTDLGLRLAPFDNLYLWRQDKFELFTYLPNGEWHPTEPSLSLAEAFFVNATRATNWVFTFNP